MLRRPARRPIRTTAGNEAYNYFLAVIFPDDQMQILDYNRVVKDLNGHTVEEFVTEIAEAFTVEIETAAVKPGRAREFGMYLDGRWYRLHIDPEFIPDEDPVKRLDVSLLQDNLLGPILGIGDPRHDKRIDFVGGIRGLQELERRVDSGEMACAFTIFPTSMADLMRVADAGEVMPPKSTWFEPKLADGLVSHVLAKEGACQNNRLTLPAAADARQQVIQRARRKHALQPGEEVGGKGHRVAYPRPA